LGRQVAVIDAQGNMTRTEYDKNGNVMAQIDALGHKTQYGYDNRDRQTILTDALNHITTTVYDKVGNVTEEIDALNHSTHYTYDALNRQISVTDARGGISKTKYDVVGNVTEQIDALNRTTRYTYDNLNRQIAVTDPSNNTSTTDYDAVGNIVAQTNALGHKTQYRYDEQNRRIQVIDALNYTTTTAYDNAGNVTWITDASNKTTSFRFDALNRQTEVIDASGRMISRMTYDAVGNIASEVDALGHTTSYTYDSLNRRVSVLDALGNITKTAYDAVGNMLKITDPNQNITTYTYDVLSRLITDTNQLGKTRTYSYDAVGNQIGLTDRNNRTRLFTYDELNRQTQEKWLDDSGNIIRTITSTYNAGSELTSISNPNSSYQYTYDLNGRLRTIDNTGTSGTPSVLLTYIYDAAGNITSVFDTINGQTGGTIAYTYNALNQVTQITQSGNGVQNKRVNLSYNPLGEMISINRYSDLAGNSLVVGTSYSYDNLSRLQQLQHTIANGSNVASYIYGYDFASRITQITESNISVTNYVTNYNYDGTNQLIGADKSGTVSDEGYSYDANGNRLNAGYITGSNNRLLSDGMYNYTYDDEGNLKTRTEISNPNNVRTFAWDYRNRLTDVTDTVNGVTQQTTYTYDALNHRIAKTVGSQTTRFVYDRGNVYLEFSGSSSTPSTRYFYGPMVDQILAQESVSASPENRTTWMLTDHLGSVRDLVNNNGTVVNHFTYGSFGNVISSMSGATVDTRYKYTGREFDAETGMYYYRARYYDAQVGKFISQDPIGFQAGDANLYRYVANSPLGVTDPTGEYARIKVGSFKRDIRYVSLSVSNLLRNTTSTISFLNKASSSFYIFKDVVTATLEHSATTSPNIRDTPIGGVLKRDPNRRINPIVNEERGHIIPSELGGSDKASIYPTFQDNFISQNRHVNRGSYRDLGDEAAKFMDKLQNIYEAEKAKHIKNKCFEDIPKPPYALMTVNLKHDAPSSKTDESYFPLRPSRLDAEIKFIQPGAGSSSSFRYETNISPIFAPQFIWGRFDNLIQSNGIARVGSSSQIPRFAPARIYR
jgi:RHS repeat-associated protein